MPMKILIDGDGCSVISLTEEIAKSMNIECHIYCDTNHIIKSDYSDVHIVDYGADSVDFMILNKCDRHDIIVTGDSGLAAMALTQNTYVINPKGFEYTDKNIMSCLTRRHIRKQIVHKTQKSQVKGIMKANIKTTDYKQILCRTIKKAERNSKRDE